mmetsp:Transcript_9158/g.24726  ORF Transcript_9158/g.24726 Transcript_9158/m.24726 type:complete len:128 (-) Transcript_9158:111-494(-)
MNDTTVPQLWRGSGVFTNVHSCALLGTTTLAGTQIEPNQPQQRFHVQALCNCGIQTPSVKRRDDRNNIHRIPHSRQGAPLIPSLLSSPSASALPHSHHPGAPTKTANQFANDGHHIEFRTTWKKGTN